MSSYRFDPADLDDLVDAIAAVPGLDERTGEGDLERPAQVSLSPVGLTLPAVWVQPFGYTFDGLDSYKVRGRLFLIVSDAPARDAIAALADLLGKVSGVVRPAGEVTHEAVALDNAAPLPALAVPFLARCTPAAAED